MRARLIDKLNINEYESERFKIKERNVQTYLGKTIISGHLFFEAVNAIKE